MKSSFLVCTVLSAVLFVAFVLSMDSCRETFEIDARGDLIERQVDRTTTPHAVSRIPRTWDNLRGFEEVARHLAPGDQLERTRTTCMIPKINVEMQKLVVTRDGREVLVARIGHYRFWAVGIGLSLVPLLVWGVLAVWTVSVPSGRPKAPP